MTHEELPRSTAPTCGSCGAVLSADDAVATGVGYKCERCAKPLQKARKPFRHPVLTTILAEDELTFLTRPLALALAAGMLLGSAARGALPAVAGVLAVVAAVVLGLVIGEVTWLGAGEHRSRLHAGIAVFGVMAAAAVAQLPFALMAVGAIVAAGRLVLPASADAA